MAAVRRAVMVIRLHPDRVRICQSVCHMGLGQPSQRLFPEVSCFCLSLCVIVPWRPKVGKLNGQTIADIISSIKVNTSEPKLILSINGDDFWHRQHLKSFCLDPGMKVREGVTLFDVKLFLLYRRGR